MRACVRSSVYMSPPNGTQFGTHMQIHLQRVVGKVPVRSISWLLLISVSDITLQMIFLIMKIGPINRQRRTIFVQGNIILRKFNMCSLGVKLTLFRTYCLQLNCGGISLQKINALHVFHNPNIDSTVLFLPVLYQVGLRYSLL